MKATRQSVAVLFAGVLLVAMGSAVLLGSFRQIRNAAAGRRQSLVVLGSANDLLSAMKDAETGQRGFLLTGDEAFLEPYLAVRDGIALRVGELRRLSAENATHKDLDALAPLLDERLAGMARLIEMRRNQDVSGAQALVRGGEGKRQMDSIRAVMRSVTATEQVHRRPDPAGDLAGPGWHATRGDVPEAGRHANHVLSMAQEVR